MITRKLVSLIALGLVSLVFIGLLVNDITSGKSSPNYYHMSVLANDIESQVDGKTAADQITSGVMLKAVHCIRTGSQTAECTEPTPTAAASP